LINPLKKKKIEKEVYKKTSLGGPAPQARPFPPHARCDEKSVKPLQLKILLVRHRIQDRLRGNHCEIHSPFFANAVPMKEVSRHICTSGRPALQLRPPWKKAWGSIREGG